MNLPAFASGSALSTDSGAAQLTLKPAPEIVLPVAFKRTPEPDTFAGFVTATVPATGTYQATLSDEAWINFSQDDRLTLKPAAARRAVQTCASACASSSTQVR